jgi:hypothetical protein
MLIFLFDMKGLTHYEYVSLKQSARNFTLKFWNLMASFY